MSERKQLLLDMLASVEQDIQDLEAKLTEARGAQKYVQRQLAELSESPSAPNTNGPYASLSVVEATVALLREVGPPFRDTDFVTEGILERGFPSDAKNPKHTVYGSLNRDYKRDDTKLAKRGPRWGLKEWELEKQEGLPK